MLAASAVSASDSQVRLRLAWGGGEPLAWQGSIQVSEGVLSEVTPLGLEADEPGSMQPQDDRTIRIFPRTARTYDGCDLQIQAPASAKLLVRLSLDGDAARRPLEIPLSKVLQGVVQLDLDDRGNRLLAQRCPGDALRVKFEQSALIFSPQETFEVTVQCNPLDMAAGASYLLAASLTPARADQQLWNQDGEVQVAADGNVTDVSLRVPLPAAEGVYDIRLALYPKRLASSLVRGKPIATRKLQVVVLAPVKTLESAPAPWQTVLEFEPANPRWWERLPPRPSWTKLPTLSTLPSLPTLPAQPVSSGPSGTQSRLGRTWLDLPPRAWQAYPLATAATGVPHLLEIEYPSDHEQTLAISLIEPNAAGRVAPIGLDSGVDVPPPAAGHKPEVRRHRLVFWPQTRNPFVLIVNRSDAASSLVGKISVLSGPTSLPPLSVSHPGANGRVLAAYYHAPLVAENFSASEALDPATGRSFDDWTTFYDAGQRLVQTLQYGGYNALVLTVAANGSALYPSRLLQPTPEFDTGVFFASGQDPLRKDVLEMLFRLCDRSGIQLIPAVQFAAPLPELEKIRQSADQSSMIGLEPIGPDGRTWIDRQGAARGLGVYYNPLDLRVQQAMTAVVGELASRYGHHASFGGVSVHLDGKCYSLLPDVSGSLDETTIQAFARETRVELPALPATTAPADLLAARFAFLQNDGAEPWLQWRAARLTSLYKTMSAEIARHRPGARLLLTPADLLGNNQLRPLLQPSLPASTDSAAALSTLGINLTQLAAAGIVVPRPQRIVSRATPIPRELDRHFNRHSELDRIFAPEGRSAAIHYLEPSPLRLPQFDAVSPFGSEKTRTLLISHIVPSAESQRERFVRSLIALDAPLLIDGGWMLPLGQEQSLASLIKVFRRLPTEPFLAAETTSSSARSEDFAVRSLVKGGKTYFYAANASPWPVQCQIAFQAPPPAKITSYGDDRKIELQPQASATNWTVSLEPFDLVGGELAGDVKIADWRVTFPADAAPQLRERVRDIGLRANTRRSPLPLANASFESPAARDRPLPAWITARGAGVTAEVDPGQGCRSPSSLHLISQPQPAAAAPVVWVRSDPFEFRTTGRLRVSAWLRISDASKQPKLRLAIEGRLEGKTYYLRANYGARETEAQSAPRPLTTDWAEYSFFVNDLPMTGLTDLRVGFDLMGEGEVWIDEVEVYDVWFDERERSELLKGVVTAQEQLRKGQLADCRIFADGYWPSFLREHVPLPAGPPITPLEPGQPIPSVQAGPPNRTSPKEPTAWQKWKGWMPALPKWR